MKKNTILMLLVLLVALAPLCAQSAADLVQDIPTIQAFKEEKVKDADINAIINAGINAPSSMNGQPWHFSVVTDQSILEKINEGMSGGMRGAGAPSGATPPAGFSAPPAGFSGAPAGAAAAPTTGTTAKAGLTDAPLAIIISAKEGSEFDAGLACQNMSIEAQLLGYGTKIISSPTIALNGSRQEEFKALLGIPADKKAVAVLLIGKAATSEAEIVSSATTRSPLSDTVTFVK